MNPVNRTVIGFVGSSGRTATSLIAKLLMQLDGVTALHEGHYLQDKQNPVIPPINMEQRRCWYDKEFRQSLVEKKRSSEIIQSLQADTGNSTIVDVAYYNSPIIRELYDLHGGARFVIIFRRCEAFVRSATTISGEDDMPVGWPAVDKELTPREKFIEIGRLKPQKGSADAEAWERWSAIERNIWLWRVTNQSLWDFVQEVNQGANDERVSFLHFELLAERPEEFWRSLLSGLNLLNEQNLAVCLAGSKRKENAKSGGYQIGRSDTWNPSERDALNKALILEGHLYER
jgi:hypothetical protein